MKNKLPMKPKSLPFNMEMIKALLSGDKTATRRPLKSSKLAILNKAIAANEIQSITSLEDKPYVLSLAPFSIGDKISVREAFKIELNRFNDLSGEYSIEYRADGKCKLFDVVTDSSIDNHDYCAFSSIKNGFTPSIHMPKWASRMTLHVVNLRIERFCDITPEEAMKEGFKNIDAFASCIVSLYGKQMYMEGYCWVIDFEMMESKNFDRILCTKDCRKINS